MYETLSIGYVPYSSDLSHPDDRRRFPFFAERHQLNYEIADTQKKYDVVILPAPANLSRWMDYKKRSANTKFIFEMVDSLTHQRDFFNILFKGIGRFIVKKEDKPCMIHRNLLIQWIKKADYVICSNPKVSTEIQVWNKNVLLSLDYLEHEYHYLKTNYSISGKMKLFWEGQGVVLKQLLSYWDVFRAVSSFCELHIVSEDSYPRLGNLMHRSTQSLLRELPIETHFHQWNIHKNPELFSSFDCGIIPLNKNDNYGWHKPANKLLSFWFSGMPTLTSDTPAYLSIEEKTNCHFTCASPVDWVRKIRKMREFAPQERENIARANYRIAREFFSNEIHDQFWINLFNKINNSASQKNPETLTSLKTAV